MTAARQDAWNADEDNMLAEIVLSHIREGSTQLRAFEEAGGKLKRTAAACGFRWNSNIRKQYILGIELAKKQRKVNKDNKKHSVPHVHSNFNNDAPILQNSKEDVIVLADAVIFFQKLETAIASIEKYKIENDELKKEINILNADKAEAVQTMEGMKKELEQLKEEYHSLISLLDRASKMAGELGETHKINTLAQTK
ncbi:RsfA family transcriptional regulator [Lederbergia citrea]|uniref:RsfA family transcriptional regulator n=1 Tax=Lederbergia citrea TaxID=2833581 RepID=A0A942UP75_9BACI|nr:RsfA family transcriptional regulator [Lederbergia citrea]MBS4203891.1 RsfA family transcriptional regulator [Lederbergia citrea]MBS4221524.1 RsfA family transcriptional regulator [Lederbergia citrea]